MSQEKFKLHSPFPFFEILRLIDVEPFYSF